MARFLTTIPVNLGFYNLGNVEAYPTGGTGPTAYGPTTYFGSDPKPATAGDSVNTPIDLGDFSPLFREVPIKGTHGGLTRKVSSFYKFSLIKERSIQVTQNYSETAYTKKTNKNTLISFYKLKEGNFRDELPINDEGYVVDTASIDVETEHLKLDDYPTKELSVGNYLFCITNDFRYLETEFSITLLGFNTDWRYVYEAVTEAINCENLPPTAGPIPPETVIDSILDFGNI